MIEIEWDFIIFEAMLLLPFFGWGVYTLYVRLQRHKDVSITFEALSLLWASVFVSWQVSYLRHWQEKFTAEYILAMLGLFMATLALYGHLAVSLVSRVFIDVLHPRRGEVGDEPRFGAAESYERAGDYESALQEYELLAKMHPNHVPVLARKAETLLLLQRPGEAIAAFKYAIKRAVSAEQALSLANRLCDMNKGESCDTPAAREALESIALRFPDSGPAAVAQRRLERLELEREELPPVPLESLETHPFKLEEEAVKEKTPRREAEFGLETLSAHPLSGEAPEEEEALTEEETAPREAASNEKGISRSGLLALEEAPIQEEKDEADAPREPPPQVEPLGLQRMDSADWNEDEDD